MGKMLQYDESEEQFEVEYKKICNDHGWEVLGPTREQFIAALENQDSQLFCMECDIRSMLATEVVKEEFEPAVLLEKVKGTALIQALVQNAGESATHGKVDK